MNITQGRRVNVESVGDGRTYNTARRLYDRLRKRSYRKIDAFDPQSTHPSYPYWDVQDHAAYVRGVKDTLNEILAIEDEDDDGWEEYDG